MIRIGNGFDVHAFAAGRRLVLGGVYVPHAVGLAGHSDADVLAHAVGDALLGAMAMGDIGGMFPDDDPQYQDADSLLLLRRIAERIRAAGATVLNVDSTVVIQRPKLAPYIDAMRGNLAACLNVAASQIGVKATTCERLGFVGREEGAAAFAAALVDA